MSITLGELKESFVHIVSTQPPEHIKPERIVNDAGRALYNLHSWRWRDRPAYPLDYIAPISISDATYTESSKTITKASGFTDYTHRYAELFEVTAGTSASTGHYVIASKTSANAIVLASSIGSSADGQTDIDGTINFPYCVLPSDFGSNGQIVNIAVTDTYQIASAASNAQIRDYRENGFTTLSVFYAPMFPTQTSTTAAPAAPLLEIFPTPTAASKGALMLTYRSGWVTLSDDDSVANIPTDYEYLLRELCQGYAHKAFSGNEERLKAIRGSDDLADLKRRDGGVQAILGPIQGGAAMQSHRPYWPSFTVDLE